MGNISFVNIVSSSGPTGNFVASAVSTNFVNVIAQMCSGGVNSLNYGTGVSGFESYHLGPQQIVSQHVADSNFVAGKVASSQILRDHLYYKTSDSGVLAARTPKLGPASGVKFIIATHTYPTRYPTITDGSPYSWTVVYSNQAVFGNPNFTTTPTLVGIPIIGASSTQGANAIHHFVVVAMNSVSMVAAIQHTAVPALSYTYTAQMAFIGQ